MNQLVKIEDAHVAMEAVLLKGDLSRLTPEERNSYYRAVCESTGLNPLTQPLEFITLNGKLRLYAKKDCTDQLRSIHQISVVDVTETEREGVLIVKTKVSNAAGRFDISTGAVSISGLKGEALANAIMKAETKSKRRATLSICGLGLLDETEIDAPPQAEPVRRQPPRPAQSLLVAHDPKTGEVHEAASTSPVDVARGLGKAAAEKGMATLNAWWKALTPELQHQLEADKNALKAMATAADGPPVEDDGEV